MTVRFVANTIRLETDGYILIVSDAHGNMHLVTFKNGAPIAHIKLSEVQVFSLLNILCFATNQELAK